MNHPAAGDDDTGSSLFVAFNVALQRALVYLPHSAEIRYILR
jgi:hypothetical protein